MLPLMNINVNVNKPALTESPGGVHVATLNKTCHTQPMPWHQLLHGMHNGQLQFHAHEEGNASRNI